MLFASADKVDTIWEIIAQETIIGNLGCNAKVSTNNGCQQYYLICVYVNDFSDLNAVQKVSERLNRLGLGQKNMGFKIDLFTHLGINSKNCWGLAPSVYTINNISSNKILEEICSLKFEKMNSHKSIQ